MTQRNFEDTDSDSDGPDIPVALTIAGSDSGGGAGIQADLKTFAACEVFGTSAVTLITAQNTKGVQDIQILPDRVVEAQFSSVVGDLRPRAAKTGALGNAQMINTVASLLKRHPIDDLVVDPVMISKHGQPLMGQDAYRVMRDVMVPRAKVLTPNRFEASALTDDDTVETVASMKEVARKIFDFGAQQVVIKGGHFDNIARDILYDGTGFVEFGADKVDTDRVHGSGCTFSSAITARLAHGDSVVDAIGYARQFISGAIEEALGVGDGVGPVNPMHAIWSR